MRIAMITPPFVSVPPTRYGGTELMVAALADGLAARGHTVTLYASGDSTAGTRVRAHYPRAVWPPEPHRELTQAATAMWEVIERREVDLVHAHCPAVLAFAPLLKVPMLYTVHHSRDEGICDLMRAVAPARVTHVAISRRQRLLHGGLVSEVVPHGLPPDRYPAGSGSGGYAAFLGRFSREKGVVEALEAAFAARVPIRLGGRPHPDDDAYFEESVAPRLAGPGVRWFGEVAHEGKVRLLGNAVATLFPVDWEEPFGLVMIESMLCGTPVIATGRGSVPEIVDEGVTGFVVDSAGAMAERLERVAKGHPRFDRRRCRETAIARFGADRMVSAYEKLYRLVAHPALAVAR